MKRALKKLRSYLCTIGGARQMLHAVNARALVKFLHRRHPRLEIEAHLVSVRRRQKEGKKTHPFCKSFGKAIL